MDLQYNLGRSQGTLTRIGLVLGLCLPVRAWAELPPELDGETEVPSVCPPLAESLMSIAQDVEEVELERALATSRAAVRDLECQPEPVNTLLLTNLLQIVGAAHLYSGDEAGAKESFYWAAASSPEVVLSASYGEEATSMYQDIQSQLLSALPASLTVTGEVEAWVNGIAMASGTPQSLRPGRHLIQWKEGGEPMHSRVIELLEGEPRTLPLGPGVELPPELEQPAPIPEPLPEPPSANRMLFMGTGLASVVGGSALVYLASRSHLAFEAENDPDDLPELQTRTNTLASTGLVLVASGVAVGSFSFTLSRSF